MTGSIRTPNERDKQEVADKNRARANKAELAQKMKEKIQGKKPKP
ncbi:hypothetical protein [Streptomyces sp. SID1121]